MPLTRPYSRDQRATIVYGMLAFVLMLVFLQLWLLTATMNAYLGGDESRHLACGGGQPGVPAAQCRSLEISHPDGTGAFVNLAAMHPAYFALVMATGIVSIAAHLTGLPRVAYGLFWLNIAFYAGLWAMTAARVIRHRQHVIDDLMDHGRSVGFFTTVAATCVLGSQFVLLGGMWRAGAALWFAGIALWALITYSVLTILTVKTVKPPLAQGISGGLAAAGRRRAVRVGAGNAARAGIRCARKDIVLLPCDVARRGDALHLDHLDHLLPLYLLSAAAV